MQILTHIHVPYTATSGPSPHTGGGTPLIAAETAGTLGLSGTTVLGLLAWALFSGRGRGGDRALVRALRRGQGGGFFGVLFKGLGALFKGTGGTLRVVARFVGGREMWGEPKSDAKFFRSGRRIEPAGLPAAQLGSVAFAPPRVSLVKPRRRRQPSPWARTTAAWIDEYQGRAAVALDRAVRAALWCAQWGRKARRGGQAVARTARTGYEAVAPVAGGIVRVLGMWHCWPYAARGLARIATTAAVVGLYVPAWRAWTIVALLTVVAVAVAIAVKWRPRPPGDDAVYGPRIWAILRDDLKLPEEEPRENWLLLPERLAAPDARIALRLPWTFRGSDIEKEQVGALINSRIPGDWVGRYSFTGETFSAVYTHKPPPKPPAPTPEPPAFVDLSDPRVREILANLKAEEFFLGFDENNESVIRKMSGELSHWAYSVGSGGGKSTTLQWLAVQMVMKCGTIVGIDPKLISLKPLEGVTGVHLYKDPDNAIDMRRGLEWAADVTAARFYEIERGTETEFPPLYVFLEETNELSGLLRAVWNRIRIKTGEDKEQAGDPIWEDVVAYMLRFGRAANVHLIAVFQDFKDNQFGGTSLQPLFRLKMLGNYDVRQWERITGLSKAVMPPNVEKAGRMVMVSEGKPISYQTPYLFLDTDDGEKRPATELESIELYNQFYRDLRERHGYSDRGLYTTPPAISPRGVPKLLRGRVEGLSRDESTNGPIGGSEGGLSDETAGRGVTLPDSVTGGVTAQRDRLRLIPGQGAPGGPEDSLKPPTLLTIAEIAREMQARGYDIEAGLIRQHKRRKESTGFPEGITAEGTEKFTLDQLITFYERRGIEKRKESEAEAEQGDAV